MQNRSQNLQSLQDSKKQCQKDLGKSAGDRERIRNEIEERHAKIEELCQKIQKASMAEVELDEEVRGLHAGDERRGSSASQSNGCCFDSAMVELLVTMGAAQRWQHLSSLQGKLSRAYGVQHQPVPATPVHVPKVGGGGDENEEEQRRRAARRQLGPPAPRGRNEGFRLTLFLILLSLQGMQVKATETSPTHVEREMEREAARFTGKEVRTKIRRKDPVPPSTTATAAASRIWVAVTCRQSGMSNQEKKRNSQGKYRKTSKNTAWERTRAPIRIAIKVEGNR